MIGLALDSPARVVIVPVQDLLGLGSEARMNLPATTNRELAVEAPPWRTIRR